MLTQGALGLQVLQINESRGIEKTHEQDCRFSEESSSKSERRGIGLAHEQHYDCRKWLCKIMIAFKSTVLQRSWLELLDELGKRLCRSWLPSVKLRARSSPAEALLRSRWP